MKPVLSKPVPDQADFLHGAGVLAAVADKIGKVIHRQNFLLFGIIN
jgi:hypothetical protein